MGMLEELNTLLERIPIWKKLIELPAKFEAMQSRIDTLESRLDGKTGTLCPICNAPEFKRTKSEPHPEFGFAGLKIDTYVCSTCKHSETRERDEGVH